MRMMFSILLALTLMGLPQAAEAPKITAEEVITSIQTEQAETAANLLLDWAAQGAAAEEEQVLAILEKSSLPPAETAAAFAAVLDAADALAAERDVDQDAYAQAIQTLRPLFTQVLEMDSTPFRTEPVKYPASLEQLYGMWYDSNMQELLIVSDAGCRVVIPWLGYCGETAYAVRLRDRSALGYSPALEVDFHASGNFTGPLAYYVSGADADHFWCNAQSQRFDKLN